MPEARRLCLIENNEVAPDHFELVFPLTDHLAKVKPGQFVNFLCRKNDCNDPLLRRPLSVYAVDGDRFSVLFRVVGRGTAFLAALRPGEFVDVLGPLGHGFDLRSISMSSVALVGGGVGTPPLFYLSQTLHALGIGQRVIVGFASNRQVIAVDRWKEMGMTPIVTTDDGSAGKKGLVTDALEEIIENHQVDSVFTCGPRPMLKAVADLCIRSNVPCQVAMEEWMGCGVGACLSCVHRVKGGSGSTEWARICVEGPVFPGEKVVWS